MALKIKTIAEAISVNRSSSGMYWNSAGLYVTALANIPRIDCDPITKQPIGILCEESRINFIRNSNDLLKAPWAKTAQITIGTDGQKAPDGSLMQLLTLSGTTSHQVVQGLTAPLVPLTRHTLSVYVIPKNNLFPIQLAYYDNSTSIASQLITPDEVGKLQLISFTFDTPATVVTVPQIRLIGLNQGGDGDQVYMWGAQLEPGGHASSRIVTAESQVTRGSDIVTVLDTSSWLMPKAETVVVDCIVANGDPKKYQPTHCLHNGPNKYAICVFLQGNKVRSELYIDGSNIGLAITDAPFPGGHKVAVRRSDVDTSICADGGAVSSTPLTAVKNPSINTLKIASPATGGSLSLNGHIRRIEYFQKVFTDAEMKAFTL